ncbi:hypothetical protein BX666DRAFT_45554 [Dichotomocladium elegans]|nr:hypothetical protein BX666DRAFT_45554 [Dichotomocladium elegans]
MVTRGKRTRVELPEPKVQQPPRKKKAHSSATHILTEKNESRNTIEPNNDQSSSQQQLNDAEAPRSTRALEENKKRATRGSKTARNNKNVELTVREMTPFSILPTEHTSPTTTPVTLTENRVSDPIIDNANNDKDQSMIECEDHPRTAVSTDISFRPIEKEGQPVSAAEVKAFTPEQVDVSVKPFPEKLTIGDVPDPTPPLDMNKVRKIVVLRHRLQSILLGKPTTGASDWTKRTIVSILNDLEMTSVTHELLEVVFGKHGFAL